MNRRTLRRCDQQRMVGLMVGAVVVALLPLFFILGDLVVKGAGSLSLDFFTRMPAPAGETGGGVAHAIVGTLIIVGDRQPDRPAHRDRRRHLLRRVSGQPAHLGHPLRGRRA